MRDEDEDLPTDTSADAHLHFPQTRLSVNPRFRSKRPTSLQEDMNALVVALKEGRVPSGSTIDIPYFWECFAGIRTFPQKLTVSGSFNLSRCTRLRKIGSGLTVKGDLKISGPIRALPEDLSVTGSMELISCSLLQHLPERFSVGGSISLKSCAALNCLPDCLTVSENLSIVGGQNLTSLPKALHVKGDLLLSGTGIESLPDDLRVDGSLIIHGRSRIKELPTGFRVGQDLVLRRCRIASLPQGLKVGRSLRIQGSRLLKSLPSVKIPGVLDLEGCTALEELPAGIAALHLKLRNCTAFRTLPENLDIRGRVDLRNCTALTELPKGMKVGFGLGNMHRGPVLLLANCSALTTLPPDLLVNGLIEVAGSGIKTIPPELNAVELSWQGVRVPHECVINPHALSAERILTEVNAELRRTMLERVGLEQVLKSAGAKELDADTDAGGVRKLLSLSLSLYGTDTRYLFCQCPSTGRKYLLRVPPGTASCRKAAAWIAGFERTDDYRPIKET